MNPPREALGGVDVEPTRKSSARVYAEHMETIDPGSMARIGMTDADLDKPAKSLAEALAAGWITASDKRQMEGVATEEDLVEMGCSPEEVAEILAEQRDRACATQT